MDNLKRKKLCWNCEGSVTFSEETCPFCGVSVVPAFLEGAEAEFAPPYKLTEEKDFGIPKSPFALDEPDEGREIVTQAKQAAIPLQETEAGTFKQAALAAVLLSGGAVFFLFSLALGLFSHNGIFTLQWDATYWFVYTFVAVVFLFIGWRMLLQLD